MATISVKNSRKEISSSRSRAVEKRNCCLAFPAEASISAESLERRNKSWLIKAKVVSDLRIQVGEDSFHLHKLPMVSKSGYISRFVLQSSSGGSSMIQIDNLPGGAKMFELVVKFSYGWKINLTASNVSPLLCAAHFLEMTDDFEPRNLISETEAFLSYMILSSWKDTFRILKSCESISSWAKDLQILRRCSEAIAWKACTENNTNGFANNEVIMNVEDLTGEWWFEDVSLLQIDHFAEVIEALKRRKIRPELIGSCIAHWTKKWLYEITVAQKNLNQKDLPIQLHRVIAENLIRILPVEKNSVSCNLLIHLFKIGIIMQVNSQLLSQVERRIALMLESCKAKDLLVKNSITVFDVHIVVKVVETYVSHASSNPLSNMSLVGRLMDEYLVLVARDDNLTARSFELLVEALPRNARYCNDNLYRAIDMYLKAHPNLTEEERSNICRVIDYNKLSQEARKHATKNDRLPMNMTTQFLLLEQVSMTRALTAAGSNYRRTESQGILRVSRGLGKGWRNSYDELKVMRQDVERLKVQLSELQFCRLELRKQINTLTETSEMVTQQNDFCFSLIIRSRIQKQSKEIQLLEKLD